MTRRLVGKVVEADVPDKPKFDFIGTGLKAFSQRSEIAALWADAQPIVDVCKIQVPKLKARGRALLASLFPSVQLDFALKGAVASFELEWVQEQLTTLGYYNGEIDGIHGKKSRAAVLKFQMDNDLLPDEWPGKQTVLKLAVKLDEHSRRERK